jgi:hypothetical protein
MEYESETQVVKYTFQTKGMYCGHEEFCFLTKIDKKKGQIREITTELFGNWTPDDNGELFVTLNTHIADEGEDEGEYWNLIEDVIEFAPPDRGIIWLTQEAIRYHRFLREQLGFVPNQNWDDPILPKSI